MAAKLLTPRKLDSLKARDSEYLESDGDGLYVRVRPNSTLKGSQVWLFVYTRPTGGRGKMVLGAIADHGLASARAWASEQRAILDRGIDPQSARRQKVDADTERQTKTLGVMLDAYINHLRRHGKVSADDVASIFRLHMPSQLKSVTAADIRTDELVKPIRKLTDAGRVRTAAKLRTALHAAFKLALEAASNPRISAELIGFGLLFNPVSQIKALSEYAKAGERVLSRVELSDFVKRLDALPNGDTKDVLRLALLLGGQRIKQLVRGQLGHDTEGKDIVILRDNKGRRSRPRLHILPLVGVARKVVTARGNQLFNPESELEVNSRLDGATKATLRIAREMMTDGVANTSFRLGDIRRTAETHLAKMGVSKDIRAQLQSHGLSGVQDRHYDRHTYLDEKAAVLMAWEGYLYQGQANNVITLRDAA